MLEIEVEHNGRGGVIHRYWQKRIKEAFEEAGWHAFIEKFDADVYVNMGNQELVVEVAMGNNERELEHMEKHLDKEFTVWVACRSEEIREELKQRMKENDLETESVVFRLFRNFLEQDISPR